MSSNITESVMDELHARQQRWPCASTTPWKLARMNLAIRDIDANLGPHNADSFRQDLLLNSFSHADLQR